MDEIVKERMENINKYGFGVSVKGSYALIFKMHLILFKDVMSKDNIAIYTEECNGSLPFLWYIRIWSDDVDNSEVFIRFVYFMKEHFPSMCNELLYYVDWKS